MKVIIDTDPGIDDAIALGLVLKRTDINIVAITTVKGNVGIDQTTTNVLRILDAYDRKDIPVYKGAYSPMLDIDLDASFYHGKDGLGDAFYDEVDYAPLQEEHAVQAINRLVIENKNEITIIALAPLTNLALAFRLNKDLPSLVKDMVIMGGNCRAVGNVTMAAEFNFFVDPIAARIIIEEFTCPKILVTWELASDAGISIEDVKKFISYENQSSKFNHAILKSARIDDEFGVYCDALTVAIAVKRNIMVKHHLVYATVELQGEHTKGQVVIDWKQEVRLGRAFNKPNTIIVDRIDFEMFRTFFLDSAK